MTRLWGLGKLRLWGFGKNTIEAKYHCHHTVLRIRGVCVCQLPSHVRLFEIPWTVAYQTSLSIGLLRQEYWSGLPVPFPGDLPNPGIETRFPALQMDSLPSKPTREAIYTAAPHSMQDLQFPDQESNPQKLKVFTTAREVPRVHTTINTIYYCCFDLDNLAKVVLIHCEFTLKKIYLSGCLGSQLWNVYFYLWHVGSSSLTRY